MEYPDLYPNDFFDGTLQPYSQLSAVTGDTQLRIPVEWLEGRKNWPEQLERMLKVFMDDNNFLHHYQTKEESNQKLNTITQNLRGLFEQSNWKAEHTEKLKEKVRNKMHRIRPQIERTHLNALRDDLQPFKEAFEKLPSHIHEEAFRAFVFHIGKDKAKNWFLALVKAND